MKTSFESNALEEFAYNTSKALTQSFCKIKDCPYEEAKITYDKNNEIFVINFKGDIDKSKPNKLCMNVNVHMDSVETAQKELLRELFCAVYTLNREGGLK